MARIRTIKPEFWTDERVVECSMTSRMLLIGIFNFADDNGNLTRSPKKIKMQVFPADMIDCEPLIQELLAQKLLIEYQTDGDKYLNIPGFKDKNCAWYQVINNPSKTALPLPEHYSSTNTPLQDDCPMERKGKERNRKNNPLPLCESPPPLELPENENDLDLFVFVSVVSDRMRRKLNAKEQEAVSDWYGTYDRRKALELFDKELEKYRIKNGGKSPPATYFTPVLKNALPAHSPPNRSQELTRELATKIQV